MKFIYCQPANKRFQWELEVSIHSLSKLGYTDFVVLFGEDDQSVVQYIQDKFPTATVHSYPVDWATMNKYHPAIKPYLWWKYLEENPEASDETYFYLDSDVILRERVDEDKLQATSTKWFGSDCGHYLNYNYLIRCDGGEPVINTMTSICQLSIDTLKSLNHSSIGAQCVLSQPSADFWKKVYEDSMAIHNALKPMHTSVQKWTAEMWAFLFNMPYFGIEPVISPELDFAWATDPISRWDETKVYHNAGVGWAQQNELFFKGKYTGGKEPFDDDLSFVDPTRCSVKYVEAIKGVKMK